MKEPFIEGIYNYCDRWCERCTFTSRCRNYEGESKLSPEQLDIKNKAFWDHLSDSLKEAIQLLYETAKAQGIDLDSLSNAEMEKATESRSFLRLAAKQHPVAKTCKAYQNVALAFVKENDSYTEKRNDLENQVQLGILPVEHAENIVANLGDCLEIIQWYLFFMGAKLQRALQGQMEDDGWSTENGFQRDSDGSAKIALIAMDKSMAAWIRLYELLPSSEDAALKALSLLERLKNLTLETFPEAMQFKRPGFD
jgi:hypothetical protein